MAGDVLAGLMLSQIIYWHLPNDEGKSRLRVEIDGEFYLVKGYGDWWEECRLTFKQARRAIEILQEKGLISTSIRKFAGAPRVHIRLEREAFLESLNRFALQGKSTCPTGQNHLASGASPLALQGKSYKQTLQAETTTDTTTAAERPTTKPKRSKEAKPSAAAFDFEEKEATPETLTLSEELIRAGLNRTDARRLAATSPEESKRQLEYLPFKADLENPGAYLRRAIEGSFSPPAGYLEAKRQEQEAQKKRAQAEATARKKAEVEAAAQRASELLDVEIENLRQQAPDEFEQFEAYIANELRVRLSRFSSTRLQQTLTQDFASAEKRRELYREWRAQARMPIGASKSLVVPENRVGATIG